MTRLGLTGQQLQRLTGANQREYDGFKASADALKTALQRSEYRPKRWTTSLRFPVSVENL